MAKPQKLIEIYECPVCGKPFCWAGADWGYKIEHKSGRGRQNVCSYHCMRQWQKERPAEQDSRRTKRKV